MTRLFVYGTLMRGEPNHRHLAGAEFEREATTLLPWEFVSLGAYPAMLPRAWRGRVVLGEVFKVDAETLARCDRLEGHPTYYRRARIQLDDRTIASTYFLARLVDGPAILSGSWRSR